MKNRNASAHNFDVRTPVLTGLVTICLVVASTTVRAAEMSAGSEPAKKTVAYGDLNLANRQGIEQLYRRIVGAAQQVCRTLNGRSLLEKQEFSICTRQSIARAVAVVDQSALTALQAIKTGQPEAMAKLAER